MNAAHPAVFLDKDGTLIDDVPYNVDPARIRPAPGAESALRRLAGLEAPLVVVTNQAGVALGRFPSSALAGVERALDALFSRCGATLAGFYACPHHPEGVVEAFAVRCDCRKPMPGLLLRAAADLAVDLSGSWMVGDILNDVEAGRRAGCRTILIDNGNETEWLPSSDGSDLRTPHHVVHDLDEAARLIEAYWPGRARSRDSTTDVAAERPAAEAA